MRNDTRPRSAYQDTRTRMRTSVPSVMRTAPPARRNTALTTCRSDAHNVTPSAQPSPTRSKYTCPDGGRLMFAISPRTHTSSGKARPSTAPIPALSSATDSVGSSVNNGCCMGREAKRMHTEIGPGVIQIDTLLGGWHNVTAGYLIEGTEPVLVETGSQSSVDALLAALAELNVAPTDLAGIAVTHIHLDHAGGVGDVARAFPNATVYVHEK